MATSLTKITIKFKLSWIYSLGLSPQDLPDDRFFEYIDSMTDGDAADKAESVHYNRYTVSASATNSHDVAGGLTDAGGNTQTFSKVKGVFVHNRNTAVGDIIAIDQSVANTFVLMGGTNPTFPISPNAFLGYWDPSAAAKAVTAATADILGITEQGGSNTVTYDLVVIGVNA